MIPAVVDTHGGNRLAMLFSGGLDSYMVWRLLNKPPAIYFITGARANDQELHSIEGIRVRHPEADIRVCRCFDLGKYEEATGYLPYRNLLFILYASLELPNHDLAFGQVLEWQTDKNPRFYGQAAELVRDLGYRGVRIVAPYADMTRSDVMREYLERGFEAADLVDLTYSCINGTDPPCGWCSNCVNRWIAMTNNGLKQKLGTTPTWAGWRSNARAQRRIFRWWLAPMYLRRYFEARRAFAIDRKAGGF